MRVIGIAVLLLLFAWYLSFSASRLDRLHHRVETSWEHLDALLEISHQTALDPATDFILLQSAYVSREEAIVDRNDAERSLSESLKLLRESARDGDFTISVRLLDELTALTEKITLAILIHLEAVNSVAKLRAKLIYRLFHLAGKAKLPRVYSFEEDAL